MNNNNYNPYYNNINQLLSLGNNPQQIVQNAIARNPQLQQTFSQYGGNLKGVVMQLAQQQGIDINQLINYIQNKGIKM